MSGLFRAIDMGSNAIRVRTFRMNGDAGRPEQVEYDRYPVRLGASAFATGALDARVAAEVRAILADAAEGLRSGRLAAVRAVGTSALRDATNGAEVRRAWREATGIDVRILTGPEEARIVALGVLGRQTPPGERHLLLDIGGGSTEFILTRGLEVAGVQSLPLGSVRLRGRWFGEADPPGPDAQAAAARGIGEALAGGLTLDVPRGIATTGIAGTITTLWRMANARDKSDRTIPPGASLSLDEVRRLRGRIGVMTAAEIEAAFRIERDRCEVILAGAIVLETIMRELEIDVMRVELSGVSDGLVEEYLREISARGENQKP